MSWLMTTYGVDGSVTIIERPEGMPKGRHGEHTFPFYLDGYNYFGHSHFDVKVYDNTERGIDSQTACRIANEAVGKDIYWSDDRLCHWMYDFECDGHWCEGLFHNNGLDDGIPEFNPLHINVYE